MTKREIQVRTNQQIRGETVRLIFDGKQLGIVPLSDARNLALQQGLDLVEVAPDERPPVCRIMDYSKYRYEQSRKAKESRHKSVDWKELNLSPVIAEHDVQTKINRLREWLQRGKHVRLAVVYKGREMAHLDQGQQVMKKVISAVEDIGRVDSEPRMEGRNFLAQVVPK